MQILSEIGTDMSRFASDAHLRSWACICPRSDESAGKRRSSRIRKGSPWLKTALVQCAHSAARTKGSYFQALYHRIRARRGVNKAIVSDRCPHEWRDDRDRGLAACLNLS